MRTLSNVGLQPTATPYTVPYICPPEWWGKISIAYVVVIYLCIQINYQNTKIIIHDKIVFINLHNKKHHIIISNS